MHMKTPLGLEDTTCKQVLYDYYKKGKTGGAWLWCKSRSVWVGWTLIYANTEQFHVDKDDFGPPYNAEVKAHLTQECMKAASW